MASAQQKLEYYVAQIDKELSKYPALNRLEQQTSVPKAYGVIGVASVFVTCVFFNIAAGFLSNLLGWALPAYFSIKALESPGHQDDIQWLTYWVIFGAFTFVESFSKVIVAWFPYYFTFKTLFILYLILPSTRGAVVVYDKIFKPTLSAQKRSTPVTTQIQESVTAPQ
ncbi:HVA22/TB2/DP1 family protein [Sporobolomyces koalae]|uniref:HVA22/TB2/DP1 family protein n=1 Tax=Sporobolomyces koalae TaxID=500713 RepID=UPI0031764F75